MNLTRLNLSYQPYILEYHLNLGIQSKWINRVHAVLLILGSDLTLNEGKPGMQVNAWYDSMKYTLRAHTGSASLC